MPPLATRFPDLVLRSYDAPQAPDRHAFAQLVLPLQGALQIEVEGRGARLDPQQGGFVPVGAWHSQHSRVKNRSLILDLDEASLAGGPWERLAERPCMRIGPAARKLVEFMEIRMSSGTAAAPLPASSSLLLGWVPLLLDSLAQAPPRPVSRLSALLAQVEAQPALAWTTESMARCAAVGVSRLHALFREELDTTPRAWLLRTRLALACALLADTRRSVADIALATGFPDQSGLTRAMRRHGDTTPAAYRRACLETVHNTR